MPRSTIGDRRASVFDKALELRNFAAPAVAATAAEAAIAFKSAKHMSFKAIVDIAAHTGYTAGTAFWTVTIEASVDNATWKRVQSYDTTGAKAQIDLPLSGLYVEDIVPGALYLRAVATKTGAPGNLTYGAFLCVEGH
ncbi:hypothetical protein IFO70_10385 [Phormidium tenue FACHB-886]|nr:hypothetical protein [Phormidium tenue FACHB-886]